MTSAEFEPPPSADGSSVPKAPTGIDGLDEVLRGGVPRGRTTLIIGGPGTGKTVFALESLYRAGLNGEPGLFLTFEEEADMIRTNAGTMGWDLEALERDGRLHLVHAESPTNFVSTGDFDLTGLLAILGGQAKALGAKRLVIDALDLLLRMFREPVQRQSQMLMLHRWLLEQGLTTILTAKESNAEPAALEGVEYMVDCAIRLDQRVVGHVATRRLRVLKYRGSGFQKNENPFLIESGGVVLMPVSSASLPDRPTGPKFPVGVDGFDELVDGGFAVGSCILVAGASGTGKTTFASSLAVAACGRGERVLYLSFEEGVSGLHQTAASAGVDLGGCEEEGSLRIMTGMPEAMGIEEHLWRIFRAIDELGPSHVIVDAISACTRMGPDAAAFDFLMRLMLHCKGRGVTCIYLNQVAPEQSLHEISGVGISSLVDALMVLEQDWSGDAHRRTLLIMKVRGSRHSHRRHAFRITDHGLLIQDGDRMAAGGEEASP